MTLLFLITAANLFVRVVAVGVAAALSFRLFSRYGNLVAAFAAGLLLTISCTHLIPEAVHSGIDMHDAGIVLLVSFVFFLLLESVFSTLGAHSHGLSKERPVPALLGGGTRLVRNDCSCPGDPARVPVLLAGTACHAFVDGVLVAAAFTVDLTSGFLVTAAILAHELPQVLGQIVIVMQAGVEKKRTALYVFLASLTSILGGAAGWAVLSSLQWLVGYAMLVSAASFIFIVLGILMPELTHGAEGSGVRLPLGILTALLAGAAVSLLILAPLHEQTHRLIEGSAVHTHAQGESHAHDHDHDRDRDQVHEHKADLDREPMLEEASTH